jgi:hypothetical protein
MDELYEQAKIAYKEGNQDELDKIKTQLSKLKLPMKTIKSYKVSDSYRNYPTHNDPDFNYNIFMKSEFHRNQYKQITKPFTDISKEKCSSTSFNLTENQKFLKNFMSPLTPYNSLLLFHEVGTGKTCSSISIVEQFIEEFKKKILVIVSTNLKDNFKKQLFDINKLGILNGSYDDTSNQCTGTTYPDLIPDRHTLNPDALNDKIKKVINERYEFKGFIEFANEYERIKTKVDKTERIESKRKSRFDSKLKEQYSNRIIVIDEVHNLRLATESSQKTVPLKLEHVLKVAENTKLILLTATPMFNNVKEIIWLLNLMLINDKRPTLDRKDIFDKDDFLTENGKRKLIEASRGYISYMRGENPYTFPIRIYPSINKDNNLFTIENKPTRDIFNIKITHPNKLEKLELIKSQMSKYQKKVYKRLEDLLKKVDIESEESNIDTNSNSNSNTNTNTNTDKDKDNRTDIQMGLQISNIVFPSVNEDKEEDIHNYYGNLAFAKCFTNINSSNTSKYVKYEYDKKIFSKFGEFLHPDKIGEYSPKLKTIIDYIKDSEGIVYIYSSFLVSGIIPLAIALEHLGFSKYGSNNILKSQNEIKPFQINNKTAQYIILSANPKLSPNNKDEIDIAKTKLNQNGEIIKVIIGSNVATEGIDFKNIREIHILEPWYHLNKIEQIIGRGVRNCSHIELPIEKRNTTIYKHVNTRDDIKRETIDVRIYRMADNKQTKIKTVENILKKNSIDCRLNQNVLYFDPDKVNMTINLKTSQGKTITNYKIGDENITSLNCYPKSKKDITTLDSSTFNMYFLDTDIERYIGFIAHLFKLKNLYTYSEIKEELVKLIETIEDDVFNYALDRMIINKRKVINNKNILGYIIYRSDKYIFQRYDKPNTRMTLEDREQNTDIVHRKLDIKLLNKKTKNVEKNVILETNIYDKIDKEVNYIMENIIQDNDKDYLLYVYDFIIDRLSGTELLNIVSDLLIKLNTEKTLDINEKYIFDSLKKSDVFLKITNNIPKYYIDIYGEDKDNMYYIIENNQFIKCPIIRKSNIIKLEEDLKTELLNKYQEINGFITNDVITNRFKMVSESKTGKSGASSGSVCHQNSTLKVDKLKKLIISVDSSFKLPKVSKGPLCDIYELTLRKNLPDKFLRPFQYYLLNIKKK